MKKIYKSFTLALAVLTFTACGNDWLDREPSDGVETSQAITNYNDAVTAYYGMYDGLQGNSTYNTYYAGKRPGDAFFLMLRNEIYRRQCS